MPEGCRELSRSRHTGATGSSIARVRNSGDRPEALATLHFTSGTTGRPKAAMHVHGAVVAHLATATRALDLRSGDIYWCTADPGWVTGTSYGIIGPLVVGCTLITDEEEFDAERWYRTLADKQVSVWYTAPTAIRMLMKAGDELPRRFDLSSLRFIASVGEPLNPEAVVWGARSLGCRSMTTGGKPKPAGSCRQLRQHGDQARLDGPSAAGHRGRGRACR